MALGRIPETACRDLWQCDFPSLANADNQGPSGLVSARFPARGIASSIRVAGDSAPNEAWDCDQAKAFARHAEKSGLDAEIVMHDRDTKFTAQFDAALEDAGLRVQKAAYRSPNTVAFVERFNQTLRQELLDHFIVFGERRLNHLVSVFIDFFSQAQAPPGQGE